MARAKRASAFAAPAGRARTAPSVRVPTTALATEHVRAVRNRSDGGTCSHCSASARHPPRSLLSLLAALLAIQNVVPLAEVIVLLDGPADVEGHSLDALWRLATCREHAAKLWPLRIEHARHRARQVGAVESQIAQRDGSEADAVADEGGGGRVVEASGAPLIVAERYA